MFVWMAPLTTVSSHSIWEKTETYELKYYPSTWVDVMNHASAHRCDQVRQGGDVSDKAARSVWTHLSRQLRNRNAQQTGKCCAMNTETSTAHHLWFDQPYACSVRCTHSVAWYNLLQSTYWNYHCCQTCWEIDVYVAVHKMGVLSDLLM